MPETRISMGDGAPHDAYDALERLVSASGPGRGQWATPPDRVEAGRSLAGGRHGAEVFEITAFWGRSPWRYVVKLGPAEEMAEEWRAYQDHFAERRNVLCAPIELATPVARGAQSPVGRRREAVVYGHVGDFSATPGATLETLEDLAGRACHGGADLHRFLAAVTELGTKSRQVLYNGAAGQPGRGSLRDLAPTLGPYLTLEAGRFDAEGRLVAGEPSTRELDDLLAGPSALLAACLEPAPDGGPPAEVRLGPVPVTGHAGGATARLPGMTVEIVAPGLDLRDLDRTVDVHGRVTGHYTASRWARIARMCPDLQREGLDVVCGAERTLVPFARLWDMLTAEEERRPVSLVHGDLNPRNVMLSGGRPFLIDFPKTRKDQPLSADLGWLELGLLRDVLAARLGFGETLLLHRLLGLASVALDLVAGNGPERRYGSVEAAFLNVLPSVAPGLVAPFRMLWAVRAQARRAYPAGAGPPWWRDYLAHLTISAARMLKWPDDEQTPAKIRVTVAAAGAATEVWQGTGPFRRWPRRVLHAVAAALIPKLAPHLPATAATAAALVDELDARGVHDPRLEKPLRGLSDRIVQAAFTASPPRPPSRRQKYFPLTAFAPDDEPPGHDALELLATAPHVTLLGGALSGKTTIIEEHITRLLTTTPQTPATPQTSGTSTRQTSGTSTHHPGGSPLPHPVTPPAGTPHPGPAHTTASRSGRTTRQATALPNGALPPTPRFPIPVDVRALASAVAPASGSSGQGSSTTGLDVLAEAWTAAGPDVLAQAWTAAGLDVLAQAWTAAGLPPGWRDRIPALLTLGAVCVVADGLDRVDGERRARVAEWLRRLALGAPRGSVVVGWRRTAPRAADLYGLDAAPFHPRVVAPPDPALIRRYVDAALLANGVEAHTARTEALVARLLRDPEGLDDDSAPRWPSRAIGSPGLLPLITTLAATTAPAELSGLNAGTLLTRYVHHLTDGRRGSHPVPSHPDHHMGFGAPGDPEAEPAHRRGDPPDPTPTSTTPNYPYQDKEPILAALARE
ncbi:phosphotransferase, partial [Sphaerisporangium aureirubrum]